MLSRTVQLVLHYDGADFSGWQRQPGERTVQGVLEEAVSRLCGTPLAVVGAGGAQKEQVNRMVKMLLGLDGRLQADAADALDAVDGQMADAASATPVSANVHDANVPLVSRNEKS